MTPDITTHEPESISLSAPRELVANGLTALLVEANTVNPMSTSFRIPAARLNCAIKASSLSKRVCASLRASPSYLHSPFPNRLLRVVESCFSFSLPQKVDTWLMDIASGNQAEGSINPAPEHQVLDKLDPLW